MGLMTLATTKKARLRSTPPLWTNKPSPGRLLTECTSGMTTASAVTPAPHQTEQSHSLRFRLSTKNSVLRARTCLERNAGRDLLAALIATKALSRKSWTRLADFELNLFRIQTRS